MNADNLLRVKGRLQIMGGILTRFIILLNVISEFQDDISKVSSPDLHVICWMLKRQGKILLMNFLIVSFGRSRP